jgi:hypothetical protein
MERIGNTGNMPRSNAKEVLKKVKVDAEIPMGLRRRNVIHRAF